MHDLGRRFAAHWHSRGFGKADGACLLALSGGVDSMTLAALLLDARISFVVAHANFGLRGAASEADEAFVAAWCRQHEVHFHTRRFDLSMEPGGTQTAARHVRYEWFEELRKARHYSAVLTAHHAGDVAETMLINLARGTGLAGLHGIAERRGSIIRPLLFATRSDILDYAQAKGLSWREDASNAKTDYLRNAVRHEVLAKLESLLPGASVRMMETASRVQDAETFYRKAVAARLPKLAERRGRDWYLPVRLWSKEPQAATLGYEWFTQFGFTSRQIPDILSLLDAASGRYVDSATHRVLRHRDFLVLTEQPPARADLMLIAQLPAQVETASGVFEFSLAEHVGILSDDPAIALLDADKIALPMVLRGRREGDYFYPLGMGGKKKKLKRFLIDLKVPQHQKEVIRILESDGRILWIAGYRIDERFKVRPSTKTVLKVHFRSR